LGGYWFVRTGFLKYNQKLLPHEEYSWNKVEGAENGCKTWAGGVRVTDYFVRCFYGSGFYGYKGIQLLQDIFQSWV
jgi:hypothetical protein